MDMNEIPVIYAVNDYYVPMAAASLRSLIRCVSKDRYYRVCIMHTGLQKMHQDRIRTMETDNVGISFYDASEVVQKDAWPSSQRFGPEIYLRLYAPLVYEQYPKLLYLDADTIILRDIADLYDTALNESVLGACWSFATPFMDGYVRRTVGLEPDEYFNSGVLILNTARFEEDRVRLNCRQILRESPRLLCFDQDALNLVLRGAYRRLPDQWNVQWTNHLHPDYDISERASRCQRVRMRIAEGTPFIIHYSSSFKPWNYPDAWGARLFWEAILDTPYWAEFSHLLEHRRENPPAFRPVSPPWKAFRRNVALAGWAYALKKIISNILRLDGEVPQ